MSDTHTSLPGNMHGIMRRLALPFLLFALVLTVLLVLSWVLLLPRFTAISVKGEVRSVDELKQYKTELQASILEYKDSRTAFLFPLEGTQYSSLVHQKMSNPKFDFLFEQISVMAMQIVPDQADAIWLSNFLFSREDKSVVIEGRVQNVGPSSMTVLAHFVDAVSSLPNVAEVVSPKFTRLEDPEVGFVSPFSIRIILQ